MIKDLDNDGYTELILPIFLTDYRGIRPTPIWFAIYKWNGKKFKDSSEQFKKYYKEVLLLDVESNIREAEKMCEDLQSVLLSGKIEDIEYINHIKLMEQFFEESLASFWIIQDRIARLTGEDPRAGLERAKEWVKSPNANLRKNAILVFKEIEDKESIAHLELLSRDSDSSVAQEAKRTLESVKKKRH